MRLFYALLVVLAALFVLAPAASLLTLWVTGSLGLNGLVVVSLSILAYLFVACLGMDRAVKL